METSQAVQLVGNVIPRIEVKSILENLDVLEATKKDYEYRILSFIDFIKENGFNENSYLDYKKFLSKRVDIKISSKNKYLISAKVLLNELYRKGIVPSDYTNSIKQFKQAKKHKVDGLTHNEIVRLWDHLKNLPEDIKSSRLKVFFCLLTLQGLRQSEILNIEVEDYDLVNKQLFVKSKGHDDKEKIHLLTQSDISIKKYLNLVKIKSGYIFMSHGNRPSNNRLSIMTIHREFKEIFKVLGISKTIHGFRHYYITRLLEKMNIRDVRKFSRHKNIEMLVVYDDELDVKNKVSEVHNCFSFIR